MQIEERRKRVEAEKLKREQDDLRLDMQVREDLKKMNQKFANEIKKEKRKDGRVDVSQDFSQGQPSVRRSQVDLNLQKNNSITRNQNVRLS